jgi:hypothetical protein
VQAITADVKGKRLLLEEGDSKPRRLVTSEMLINKFQHKQEKAKGREEWAQCNKGHWRCPFFKYCCEKGIKLPTTENCPECTLREKIALVTGVDCLWQWAMHPLPIKCYK